MLAYMIWRFFVQDEMASMRAQVSALEAEYEALYAAKVQQQQATLAPASTGADGVHVSTELQLRYTAAKEEMAALRSDIEVTKQKLSDFDLFTASLEVYLGDFHMASSSPAPSPASSSAASSPSSSTSPMTKKPQLQQQHMRDHHPGVPQQLTEAACQEIIKSLYRESIKRKWSGRSVGTGAEMLGWSDQRFVDGDTLQFALSKSFPHFGKEYLMQKTWDILTSALHMRTLQRSTMEVTILQRISDDILVLERRVNHEQLHRISCVQLLIFRIRTETGYIVAYKAVNPPGSPQESTAAAAAAASPWNQAATQKDQGSATTKPKLAWVDTMQWFVFDDLPLESLDDAASTTRGSQVLIGGRTANRDDTYANFFLFEVVTYIIRWESAVAGARLLVA